MTARGFRAPTGQFREAYAAANGTLLVVQPDGYIGHCGNLTDAAGVAGYAVKVVAPPPG